MTAQGSTQAADRAIVIGMRRGLATGALIAGLSAAGVAHAQAPASPETDLPVDVTELEGLVGDLQGVLGSELQAGDCVAACEALGSMQRAADRICDLEPGPRCDRAQSDVEAARERVRQACPDCEALRYGGQREEKAAADKPKTVELGQQQATVEDEDGDAAPEPAMAPPAEGDRGGCAACAVGEGGDGRGELAWLGLALGLAWRRRRR